MTTRSVYYWSGINSISIPISWEFNSFIDLLHAKREWIFTPGFYQPSRVYRRNGS